jgi:ABC transporter substrate-binding protein (ThiB subfamily)
MSKDGLGEVLFERFEKKTGIHIQPVRVGDAGSMVARIQSLSVQTLKDRGDENKDFTLDIALGVDTGMLPEIQSKIQNVEGHIKISKPKLWPGKEWVSFGATIDRYLEQLQYQFFAFDYGHYAWMINRTSLKNFSETLSLQQLLSGDYQKKWILENPDLSAPGQAFIVWAFQSVPVMQLIQFFKQFHSHLLTMTPGWDQAYSLFLKNEAPFVWSYVTSEAYHRQNENVESKATTSSEASLYRAILFDDRLKGQPLQIEGAVILTPERDQQLKAYQLIEFLQSDEIQTLLPLKQWMFPVKKTVILPDSFKKIPQVQHSVLLETRPDIVRGYKTLWKQWISE